MNDEHDKPENENPLDREEIHEQNRRAAHEAHQHENQNPGLSKSVNPTRHNADGR